MISYLKSLKPIILSHHPDCEKFNNHSIKIGKYRFCIGCFIGYPTAVISVIVISFFLRFLDSQFMFTIGTVLMASFLLGPLNLTKAKTIKIVQKFLFNLGAAFLFWWIWTAPYLFINNLISFLLIFGPLFMIVNAYHGYSVYMNCKKCDYALNWDICPGFVNMKNYIKKNNLPDLFKSQG